MIFTDVSGTGKTSLIKKLAKEYGLRAKDVFEYVARYLLKKKTVSRKELRKAYQALFLALPKSNSDILEIANDWPEKIIPSLVSLIRKRDSREILLILCRCSPKTARKRRIEIGKIVLPRTIKQQESYGLNFFKNLCHNLKIGFLAINTERNFESCYQKLVNFLGATRTN